MLLRLMCSTRERPRLPSFWEFSESGRVRTKTLCPACCSSCAILEAYAASAFHQWTLLPIRILIKNWRYRELSETESHHGCFSFLRQTLRDSKGQGLKRITVFHQVTSGWDTCRIILSSFRSYFSAEKV